MIGKLFTEKMEPLVIAAKSSKQKTYDLELEGLRGCAALMVGFGHVIGLKSSYFQLDPAYQPHDILSYLVSGHAAVLIFFVISGYVIGLTTTSIFSKRQAFKYILRRLIRLFPIYFIAIIFSISIQGEINLPLVLGHLAFLQNWLGTIPPIDCNPAVWSLNYEMVYYLLFLIVWYLKPNIILLFLVTLAIAGFGWFNPQLPQLISSYASGWLFWLSGLWLAWRVKQNEENYTPIPLLSCLILLTATSHFAPGSIVLNGLGFSNPNAGIVSLSDIALLPICILIVAGITKRILPRINWLRSLCFFIPLPTLIALIFLGRIFENSRFIMAFILTLLAFVLIKNQLRFKVLKLLAPFGVISYAFYVLHMPMMVLIQRIPFWQGTIGSYSLRLVLWFLIVLTMSILLERSMQPAIKHWFSSKSLLKSYI